MKRTPVCHFDPIVGAFDNRLEYNRFLDYRNSVLQDLPRLRE